MPTNKHTHKHLWFSDRLIAWFATAQRTLPWRGTTNPYKVWLSEIILQQTRVVQGLPYYERFLATFPTVQHLAKADEAQVLKLWQGLGYYSRAKNLHHTAQYITFELKGVFPTNYEGLVKLKGIGDYTASAIASFCYNEPCAVVDGNVYRVLSRVFGIETAINSTQGAKEFKELAVLLLDKQQAGLHNQALMEFGALQCVPQSPDCNGCVLRDKCWAFQHKKVEVLPVKEKKLTIKKRYFNYIVWLSADKKTQLQRREAKDIWQGLYEFPLIETTEVATATTIKQQLALTDEKALSLYNEQPIVHKLTHQHIYTHFWIVETEMLGNAITVEELHEYPVSALTANFIASFWKMI